MAGKKGKGGDKMTEQDLVSLCTREWEEANSSLSTIIREREAGLNGYNQEKYGNEEDGLSGYVSSDIRDTVEWALPQIVDIFVGGSTPVAFTAENAEDAQAADIEARYCQYVFERQNPGTIFTIQWFKDALIQKVGVVKAYWEDEVEIEREEYKGKSMADYALLMDDEEFEIDEVSITLNDVEYSEEEFLTVLNSFGPENPVTIDIVQQAQVEIIGHRKRAVAQVRVAPVPPEDFAIKKDWNSILVKDCPYTADRYTKTRSQLIEMGYDRSLVDALPKKGSTLGSNEKQNRFKKENIGMMASNATGDTSVDELEVKDHFIRADFNNDGVAELRFVRTVGDYALENHEVDRNIYHPITPYLQSHKFFGKSMADIMADIQRAKSQLKRNMFDNVMYSAIPRKKVKGSVNIDDLLTYIPGGLLRMGSDGEVENDIIPFVAGDCLTISDSLDKVRAERTGFSRETAGLDPSALANSTNLVGMAILSQGQLAVKMIATLFAHSGFSSLMLHIREMIQKYESQERVFDLTGEYLQTDPRAWRKQRSADIQVGIGFAGKQEKIAVLERMQALQAQAIEAQGGLDGPLTNAQGVYNTIKKLAATMGVRDVDNYFQNPAEYQAPPPPPPSLLEIQTKAEIDDKNAKNKLKEQELKETTRKNKADEDFRMAELDFRYAELDGQEEQAANRLKADYARQGSDNTHRRADRTAQLATKTKSEKEAKKK